MRHTHRFVPFTPIVEDTTIVVPGLTFYVCAECGVPGYAVPEGRAA